MKVLHEENESAAWGRYRVVSENIPEEVGSSQRLLWGSDDWDECELKIVGNFIKWEIKSITEKGKILCKGSGVESSLIGSRN